MAERKNGKDGTEDITRRKFVAGAAIAPFAAKAWMAEVAASGGGNLLLVGTQTTAGSKGIYSYVWNAASGDMSAQQVAVEVEMPTFLAIAPDGHHVYSANELTEGDGKVTGFSLDRATRKLTEINAVSSLGGAPCHVTLDHTGHSLYAANYTGGSAVSFKVAADGKLSAAVEHLKFTEHGPNASRQEGPHAHRVTVSPDNRFLLVNDLGGDAIRIFHIDAENARLKPNDPPAWKTTPGAGPRSLRFHPNGRWAYCMNEMECTAELLYWDAAKGTLSSQQKIDLLANGPDVTATASESAIDKAGAYAYFAVRGADTLTTCRIDATTGKLTFQDRMHCGGKVPRHITLDPSDRWLLIANEVSGNIAVLKRDTKTGKLSETGKEFAISKPQCLLFA